MIKLVHRYATDMGMELDIGKCAVYNWKRDRSPENEVSVELIDGAMDHIGKCAVYNWKRDRSPENEGETEETEDYTMVCQDRVYGCLVYRKMVMKQPLQDTRSRACKKDQETTMDLLAACPKYAPTLYISRHDMALRVLYYLRHIHAIVQNENVKIFWNFPFSTTAEITANKPDTVVLDKLRKTIFVIEKSCPSERNIQSKELEKYRDHLFRLKHTYPGLTNGRESSRYQQPTSLGLGYSEGISHGNGMHPELHGGCAPMGPLLLWDHRRAKSWKETSMETLNKCSK
ncbi:hypothetical protein QE152_g8984 [Popillia japonica]|uniref:Uncharacterized protein n=1 Tax=Popillia japonica TaxID=7064 RepID=A0AAW1M0T6_POPJA